MNDMQNTIGDFSSIFAPQNKDNTLALKILLDAIVMITAIGSSYAWGFAFIEAGIVAKEYAGISKDITNAAVNSFALGATKDSLSSTANVLGTQNTLSAALGAFFELWESMESEYVKTLFDGSNDADSIVALQSLIGAGDLLVLPSNLDLSGLTGQAEKILYGQLIPAGWSVSPQNLHPVILRKPGSCSVSPDSDMLQYMDQDTLKGGYVCYNGDAFYVVNAEISVQGSDNPTYSFTGLPGGTHSQLNGNSWGGVILEDMVQSSYDAYTLNGDQNGYVMPYVSSIIDGKGTEGDVVFQNGIRTPGFFSLPICDDVESAVRNTITSSPSADQGTTNTSATIYAQFDGSDKLDYMVVPRCVLNATWPRSYGDVYFGQNNCLYDSTGTVINGQCCTEKNTQSVVNPYYG
ncbi:uncharacterized protein N7482_003194 [Penicillium canariense]|uniref:Uncharacterized protein n=1 Tax=Penicillium canariense TaxID=189055 RepID=A0A9W9I6Q6_9EURO|nr:uncharacterized protein N7482_003194 [Penicillium canariense]KAJ5167600.1 hypothetical protein N7482_003194 [Penicillium canariense]